MEDAVYTEKSCFLNSENARNILDKLYQLQYDKESMKSENAKLQNQLDAAEETIRDCYRRLNDLGNEVQSFSKSAEEQNELFEKLQRKKNKLKEMKSHHSEQILRNTHLENSLRQAQESQNSLVEKIQSLESCLSEKNQQLADLVEVIHEYEKVIDDRQTVIMTKSEEVNRLTSDCNELHLKIKDLEEQCEYSFKESSNSNAFELMTRKSLVLPSPLDNMNNCNNDRLMIGECDYRAPWLQTHSSVPPVRQKSLADELIEADSELQNSVLLVKGDHLVNTFNAHVQTDSLLPANPLQCDRNWREKMTDILKKLITRLSDLCPEKSEPNTLHRSRSSETVGGAQKLSSESVLKLTNSFVEQISKICCEPNPTEEKLPKINVNTSAVEGNHSRSLGDQPTLNKLSPNFPSESYNNQIEVKRWTSLFDVTSGFRSKMHEKRHAESYKNVGQATVSAFADDTFWITKRRENTTQTDGNALPYSSETNLEHLPLNSYRDTLECEKEEYFATDIELITNVEMKQLKMLTEDLRAISFLASSCSHLITNDANVISFSEPSAENSMATVIPIDPREHIFRLDQLLRHISILVPSLTSKEKLSRLKSYQQLNILQTLAALDKHLSRCILRILKQNVERLTALSDQQISEMNGKAETWPLQTKGITEPITFNTKRLLPLKGFPRRLKIMLTVWEECLRPFMQKRMHKLKGWMFSLLGLFCVLVFVGLYSREVGYKTGVVAEKSRAFNSSSNWIKIHFQNYVNSALIYPHGPPPL